MQKLLLGTFVMLSASTCFAFNPFLEFTFDDSCDRVYERITTIQSIATPEDVDCSSSIGSPLIATPLLFLGLWDMWVRFEFSSGTLRQIYVIDRHLGTTSSARFRADIVTAFGYPDSCNNVPLVEGINVMIDRCVWAIEGGMLLTADIRPEMVTLLFEEHQWWR